MYFPDFTGLTSLYGSSFEFNYPGPFETATPPPEPAVAIRSVQELLNNEDLDKLYEKEGFERLCASADIYPTLHISSETTFSDAYRIYAQAQACKLARKNVNEDQIDAIREAIAEEPLNYVKLTTAITWQLQKGHTNRPALWSWKAPESNKSALEKIPEILRERYKLRAL